MTNLDAFIAGLPKAELHMHIEGSLEPELMFELASRNRIDIPYGSVEELKSAYSFNKLQDFLDIYYAGAAVLRRSEDFRDLGLAYFRRAAADNVRHAEIFFDPQTHTERGVPMAAVMEGLLAACEEAERELGITSRLILCFLRHLDEESALATFASAQLWLDRIAGVGLDSSEVGHPPSKFADVFARAGAAGLKRVAHAGEEGPPDYVREALDILHVDRIDHGNRALEDPELVDRLAREGMTLTVCPLSNLKLCVVPDIGAHPIAQMMKAGLKVTLNSDDPAYFGGYINANYSALAATGLVSRNDMLEFARNSFTGSFLEQGEVARHLEEIAAYDAAESAA